MTELRKQLAHLAFALGTNLDTVALKMGIDKRTLFDRLDHPGKFKVKEMRDLFDALKMTTEEREQFIKIAFESE